MNLEIKELEEKDFEGRIRRTYIGDICDVSTVKLHASEYRDYMYETLVFGGPFDMEGNQYKTEDEARQGHADMLAWLISSLEHGLIPEEKRLSFDSMWTLNPIAKYVAIDIGDGMTVRISREMGEEIRVELYDSIDEWDSFIVGTITYIKNGVTK